MARTTFMAAALFAIFSACCRAGEIHDAAEKGDVARVERLLTRNPRLISSLDEHGDTPLNSAARFDKFTVIDVLLKRGAAVNARAGEQLVPLLRLAVSRYVSCAKSTENDEATRWKAIVATLLDHGVRCGIRTAIHLGDVARVRQCLREERGLANSDDVKPLCLAALEGRAAICKLLLEYGADPNEVDDKGYPVLVAALKYPEIVTLLLDSGANHLARVQWVGFLVSSGREVRDIGCGAPLLHYAAAAGAVKSAELLLQKGVDVNAVDGEGQTALHVATFYDQNEMVKFLLGRGANANARDWLWFRTPLFSYEIDAAEKLWQRVLHDEPLMETIAYGRPGRSSRNPSRW
jgi:ankyrin repeat protein